MSTPKRLEHPDPTAYWFTLGQSHSHVLNGKTLDRNIVIEIPGSYETARATMFELFGSRWSHQYEPGSLDLGLFPRGIYRIGKGLHSHGTET